MSRNHTGFSLALLPLAVFPALALAAECSPVVRIDTPWARATPPGAKVGAVYLQISGSCGADALVGAESAVAGKVEIHTMFREDGKMLMRAIPQLAVPANERVTLQPGGLHIMLLDIKQPLKEGERVELTLLFEKAGRVPVVANVAALGAPSAPSMPAMPMPAGQWRSLTGHAVVAVVLLAVAGGVGVGYLSRTESAEVQPDPGFLMTALPAARAPRRN